MILRPWSLDDVPTLLAAHRQCELAEHVVGINDAVNARSWVRDRATDRSGLWWAIALGDAALSEAAQGEIAQGEAVGGVALYRLDGLRSCASLAYWVLPEHRRRGYASSAAQTVADWALRQGWYRLELEHRAENAGSARVAELAGFVWEGVARERAVDEGARHDLVLRSRLARDPWPVFVPLTMQN